MDYIGYKCPVCDKYFHVGDDVVVCPECGTPHHRECYHSIGRCANEDKHKDGYDYQQDVMNDSTDNNADTIECKKCGFKNDSDAFFCNKCGNALFEVKNEPQNQNPQNQQNPQGQPFPSSPFGSNPNVIMFDPLAGVNPNTDMGDSVTAGEVAKFVKQNTPYFILVFNNIKKFARSRFNFSAMIFGGGYLLYRKMYKLGTIITAIQTALTILYLYLNYYISTSNVYDKLFEASTTVDLNAFMHHLAELPDKEFYFYFLAGMISVITLAFDIVIGACANRMYYKHCLKEINKVKTETQEPAKVGETLVKRGGVNTPLALSLWFTYIVISYLPQFFS